MVRLFVVSPMGYYEDKLHYLNVFLASGALFDFTYDGVDALLVLLLCTNSDTSQFAGYSDLCPSLDEV